ncbi:hypothetical protein Krac_8143 [Ktedonobacter racemifer DSM 44963]|uniref:Uncharacterized protein n=1 Tax=Ktedonobacter racemifer DSM 44963 TaxID=485913 RepID=D6TM27_KTERA|nr:hypothetical protein Krac_8143 [Ktedonobacter racemifer DSM 44963]
MCQEPLAQALSLIHKYESLQKILRMMRGKGVEKNAPWCIMMCFQLGETSDVFTERVSPLVWGKTRHLQRIASVFFLKIAYLCISDRAQAQGVPEAEVL